MINIKKHIPNTITCLNLLSGCVAAVFAFRGDLVTAAGLVYLAGLFDFFDGFAARALKAYSPLGKELDSLADVISFGFVPALVVFNLLSEKISTPYWGAEFLPYIAFVLVVFSALRLAIFNIDDRQTTSFIGLPTPANGLFWVSLAAWGQSNEFEFNAFIICALVLVFSYLLVAKLPMFSLKIKSFSLKTALLPLSLIVFGALFIGVYGYLGISIVIGWYILSSLFVFIFRR